MYVILIYSESRGELNKFKLIRQFLKIILVWVLRIFLYEINRANGVVGALYISIHTRF